jgi:AsmA protein
MKRFLKWFFGILITLIILVVAAAISLPYLIDPNNYKDQIIAQIKPHMLGRDLKIPGKIKLSVFPWLGVEIGDTVIGNADGFVLKPFMTIKQSRAHIRLLSLLTKTPEIGSLDIDGVVLNLQRDAEGRNNWSDLAKAKAPTKAQLHKTALTTTTAPAAAAAMIIPRLKVEGIHLKDATINFDDRLNKNEIVISKLNIDAGPIDQFNPIPLRGQLNYYSKTQGLVAASAFATTVAFTPAMKFVNLQQLVINTNIAGETLNNKTIATSLKVPELKIDLDQEKVEAKPFHLRVNNMQSDGRLNLRRFSNPIIQLVLNMQELDLDSLLPAHSKAVAPVPTTTNDTAAADTSPAIFAALIPLKTADMQGTLNFKKLTFNHLQFENVRLNLLARGGHISALPDATLYQGSYQGDLQIDVNKLPVRVRLKQELHNVPMGPITLALTGKESLTGTANMEGQFFSEGNTLDEITRQLNGDATFNIRDVELTLMDVEQLVLQKWYDKLKLADKQQAGKKVTAFDSVRGTIRVQNGIAYNHDFSAVAQRVHLTGSGQANLVKQTVDYTLITIPKKSMAINVGNTSYDLKDKRIPTYIRGPWSKVDVQNDLGGLMKADVQSAIDTKKQAAQDKLKTRVDEEKAKLKDKLQDLFKR